VSLILLRVRVRVRVIGIEGKMHYFTCFFVILGRDHRGHPLKHSLKTHYGTIAVKSVQKADHNAG